MVTFVIAAIVFGFYSKFSEANQCFDFSDFKTCTDLAQEVKNDHPDCSLVQDAASYVTITECSDDLTFNVNEAILQTYDVRSVVIRIQLTCTNWTSSEIVTEEIVATFSSDDDELEGIQICDFDYLEKPGIVCSLQSCGLKKTPPNQCIFGVARSTDITCYESSTTVSRQTSAVSHNPISTATSSLTISNTTVSSFILPTASSSHLTNSSSYSTNPSDSNPDYSESKSLSASSTDLLSEITKSMVATVTRSSTDFTTITKSTVFHDPSISDSSSNLSVTVSNLMVVLIAVILPILFVGIVCAFAMSGVIFYRSLSTKNNRYKESQIEDSNVRNTVDLKLADAYSIYSIESATTIFQDLFILQDTGNNETAVETQSCISSVPSGLKSSQHHIPLESVALNEEDSLANTDNSQNTQENTVTHLGVEFDDKSIITQEFSECISVKNEEVSCEWDRTRRNTNLTSANYSDMYYGSITSYISP